MASGLGRHCCRSATRLDVAVHRKEGAVEIGGRHGDGGRRHQRGFCPAIEGSSRCLTSLSVPKRRQAPSCPLKMSKDVTRRSPPLRPLAWEKTRSNRRFCEAAAPASGDRLLEAGVFLHWLTPTRSGSHQGEQAEWRGLDDCAVSEAIGAHEKAAKQRNAILRFPISGLEKS